MNVYLNIYNASAGSGKTTTLIKEVIQLCLNNVDEKGNLQSDRIRYILGLTFTNAVANELKKRLIDVLYDTISDTNKLEKYKQLYYKELSLTDKEIQERARQLLRHLLHHYSDLSLMTIDSFSNRVLKSFASELNYSLMYEIAEHTQEYYQMALDAFIDNIQDDETSREIVQYIRERKKTEEVYGFGRLSSELLQVLDPLVEKDISAETIHYLKDRLKKIDENKWRELIKEHDKLCEEEIKKFNQSIREIFNKFNGVYYSIETGRIENSKGYLNGKRLSTLNKIYQDGFKNYEELKGAFFRKEYSANEEPFKDAFSAKSGHYESLKSYRKNIDLTKELISKLVLTRLAIDLLDELKNIKRENDVVFFSDFTREISKIVQEEENVDFIFERIGTRYRHFLIDEFQDTSTQQFHNLLPLIHNAMASGYANYIVGDPKQSIYRWRNANVAQFMDLYKHKDISFERLKKEWEKFKPVIDCKVLVENYRSAKDIVEFNNRIFHQLQYENFEIIKDVYDDAQQVPKNIHSGYVEVISYNKKKDEGLFRKEDRINQFAEDVFKIIEECVVRHGFQQTDICVLVRGNKDIKKLVDRLSGRKLSNGESLHILSPEGLSIYMSEEVDFIIAFMKLLLNTNDHIANAICWKYVLKTFDYKEEFHKNFLEDYKHSLQKEFSAFQVARMDIYQLVLKIINTLEIPQNAAVQKLLYIANAFLSTYIRSGNTLQNFISFWEKNKTSFFIETGHDVNAVQLMTIHKSKGLEFPVVITYLDFKNRSDDYWYCIPKDVECRFLPEKSVHINFKDLYLYLPTNKIKEFDPSYGQQLEAEEHLENINLIYVAFTRAISRLYVFADDQNKYYKELILPKIKDHYKPDVHKYVFGDPASKPTGINKYVDNKIELSVKLEYNSNIVLANNASADSDARITGIKVHKVLEYMNNVDLDRAITKARDHGIIRDEDAEPIRQMIQSLFLDPRLKHFFDSRNVLYSLNEADIFDGKEVYRPDKIIFTKDEQIVLLEFKTGEEVSTYKKQLNTYIQILQKTYPQKRVCGYLIYLKKDVPLLEKIC